MSTARRSPAASSAAPEIGSLPTVAIILSALGAALCAVVLYIHHQLSAGQGAYTSFCDLSERLSCDVVLASSYATLLGIPVGGWALAAYVIAAGLAFSLRTARGEARVRGAATLVAFTAAMAVDEIRDKDPKFYAWYISQPIVDLQIDDKDAARTDQITLVEFSDFECPACGRAFIDLGNLMAKGDVAIHLVHRNFPLNMDCNPDVKQQGHPHACQAAVAYECASAQGKAHEYYDTLFKNQSALDQPSLIGYAARLGLDQGEFERCLSSPAAAAKVAADVAAGAKAGVESTPTFFINGRRVPGSLRPEHFQYAMAIERAGRSGSPNQPAAKP